MSNVFASCIRQAHRFGLIFFLQNYKMCLVPVRFPAHDLKPTFYELGSSLQLWLLPQHWVVVRTVSYIYFESFC